MKFPLALLGRLFISTVFISILSFFPSTLRAQVQIWGVSQAGGTDDIGTVFSLYDNGTGYATVTEFHNSQEGKHPKASVSTAGETIYGITSAGGEYESGTIFKFEDDSLIVLVHLQPNLQGTDAAGEFLQVGDQTWITTTFNGAANNSGALLRFDSAEGLSVLEAFSSPTTGGNPSGALIYNGATQSLFGTCSSGGNGSAGTVYRYSLSDNALTVVHHFGDATDGQYPQGGVILGSDGMLYGTTQSGGLYGQGVIFGLDPETGVYLVLHHLNSSDGRYPFGNLIESSPGTLLGVCSEGGSFNTGTVFKCTTEGSFSVLKQLNSSVDGGFSKSGLTSDGQGAFIGVTEYGGANGFGTLFTITESGTFYKVHDFDYTNEGSNPVTRVSTGENGAVYGVCAAGGAADFGTLFSFSSGIVTKIHDFSLPLDGASPRGLNAGQTAFFGTTENGGRTNNGLFFTTLINGQTTKLHSFDSMIEGRSPNGVLTVTDDGDFVGTARFGGLDDSGTIFSISPDGELTLLYTFATSNDGRYPYSAPVSHSDGNFYGTTVGGGIFDDGVIYRLDGDLTYTVLYELFSFYDGAAPEAGLTVGADGELYGLTTTGGSYNAGTLFKFDLSAGYPEVLHQFDPDNEGGTPKASLVLHSDGVLYGATSQGTIGGGALFRYSDDSGFELLHALDPTTDGSAIGSAMSESTDGTLFGFAAQGGQYGQGTAFKFDETNGFTTLHHFQSPEAALPTGTPVLLYPECIDDGDCSSIDPCIIARCIFGNCAELPIEPVFEALEIGPCETDLDQYDLTVSVTLGASPGGELILAGQSFELNVDQTEYVFQLNDLTPTGQSIDLDYTFAETGCSGTTGDLGQSPAPCPPILITFVLDAGGLEPDADVFYIGGNFQGWSPAQHPMSETQPGIWQATLGMSPGQYEFNFFSGPTIFEAEYVIGECGTNGKRSLAIGEVSDTLKYCWSLCVPECATDGTDNYGKPHFTLLPNLVGTGDSMRVEWHRAFADSYTYRIVDSTGKTVVVGILSPSGDTRISIGSWSPGIYALIVEIDGRTPLSAARFAVR